MGGYVVYSGDWDLGRIYESPDSPDALVLVDDRQRPMTRSGHMPTLEEAKAQFQKSWDAWRRGRIWRRASGVAGKPPGFLIKVAPVITRSPGAGKQAGHRHFTRQEQLG